MHISNFSVVAFAVDVFYFTLVPDALLSMAVVQVACLPWQPQCKVVTWQWDRPRPSCQKTAASWGLGGYICASDMECTFIRGCPLSAFWYSYNFKFFEPPYSHLPFLSKLDAPWCFDFKVGVLKWEWVDLLPRTLKEMQASHKFVSKLAPPDLTALPRFFFSKAMIQRVLLSQRM